MASSSKVKTSSDLLLRVENNSSESGSKSPSLSLGHLSDEIGSTLKIKSLDEKETTPPSSFESIQTIYVIFINQPLII